MTDTKGTHAAKWEYFDSPELAESKVTREITRAKLSQPELIRLDALLTRIAEGKGIPQKDFKYLEAESLWEVRFQADKRTFRLLYSRESSGTLVLVALHFLPKKQNKLPKQAFTTARARLKVWRSQRSNI